jgi:hypothetical protein
MEALTTSILAATQLSSAISTQIDAHVELVATPDPSTGYFDKEQLGNDISAYRNPCARMITLSAPPYTVRAEP